MGMHVSKLLHNQDVRITYILSSMISAILILVASKRIIIIYINTSNNEYI